MKKFILFFILLGLTLPCSAEWSGRLKIDSGFTVYDLKTELDCSPYANGGKLTTDSDGNIICADDFSQAVEPPEPLPERRPSDPNVSPSAQALWDKLEAARGNHTYFGQSEPWITEWKEGGLRETIWDWDAYVISGEFPGMFEINGKQWRQGDPDENHNDGRDIYINVTQNWILPFLKAGGILGVNDCAIGGNEFDKETVNAQDFLPGGSKRQFLLDRVEGCVNYLNTLKDESGDNYPVLIRPYIEGDAGWFWWGTDKYGAGFGITDEEYRILFADFVDLMRNTFNYHNALFVYSPTFAYLDTHPFESRYPGDEYVDVIGIDAYCSDGNGHNGTLNSSYGSYDPIPRLQAASDEATNRNKLFAYTEGCRKLSEFPKDDYWIEGFFDVIKNDPKIKLASYIMVWSQWWGPNKSRGDSVSFNEMMHDPYMKTIDPQDIHIEYWVDPENGNDDNSGYSCADAWKTMQHATNTAHCGDIIKSCGKVFNNHETVIGKHCLEGNELIYQGFNINCSSGTCFRTVDASYIIFDDFKTRGDFKAIAFRGGEDDPSKYKNKSTHHITLRNSDIGEAKHWGLAFSQHPTHATYDIIVKDSKIHDVIGSGPDGQSNGHCVKLSSWDTGGPGYMGNGKRVKFINNEICNCDGAGIQDSVDWDEVEMAYNTCSDASRKGVYKYACLSTGDDSHTSGSIHHNLIYSTIGKQWGINVDRGAKNIDVYDNDIDKNYIGIIAGLNKSPDGKNVSGLKLLRNNTTNTIDRDYVQKHADDVIRQGNSFD